MGEKEFSGAVKAAPPPLRTEMSEKGGEVQLTVEKTEGEKPDD